MRSIRLSLLLYFLGLLALAVGTASVLAYQTAQQTLEEKKAATQELIEAQFRKRCEQEQRRLDDNLLVQAQALARMVRDDMDPRKITSQTNPQHLLVLGLLNSNLAPNGYLLAPGWVGESRKSLLYWELVRRTLLETTLGEEGQHDSVEESLKADYIQVDGYWVGSYLSPLLLDERLPLDPAGVGFDQAQHARFDEVALSSGQKVRRVVFKTWVPHHFLHMIQLEARRGRNGPVNPGEPRLIWPALFVHCAYDIDRYDDELTKLEDWRRSELKTVTERGDLGQARLWHRLLLIGEMTFLAALAGSFWLVRLGLSPLRRLSEAVSKVSPRDFRLPFEDTRLPSELKPIVEHLKEVLALLKRAFGREKQATADISHELRTPLAVLLTTTELGLRKPRTVEQYRELLQDCRLSAQQMNEIINRLLTLARLDAGVDQLQRRPVDLAQLAEQCISLVRPLAEARGLTVQFHHVPALPVEADADKLREVLNNLLHNAIQYNRPNGRVDVRVGQQDHQLCMEVQDTGIGISAEARPLIFERFYRADPSRGGDGLHAGLGLALVKEYIDLMGGRIDVETAEGQGSTFRIWLPA